MDLTETAQSTVTDESALWQTYGQRIYRYLLRLTGQRETAEDLTQETFLLALRDLRRTGRLPDHPAAWIFRIATNLARDQYRRRRLIAWLPFLPDLHGGSAADTADLVAEQDLVAQTLRRLPPEAATLLLLKDGEGFDTREIAQTLGQNYDAVRKRLARARIQFRAEYAGLKGEQA